MTEDLKCIETLFWLALIIWGAIILVQSHNEMHDIDKR